MLKLDNCTSALAMNILGNCVVCSLCTTLSVEWEPDLIAISLLYLSCRLMKFKVDNWVDKPAGYTDKWYKFFVSDVNLNIIESEL